MTTPDPDKERGLFEKYFVRKIVRAADGSTSLAKPGPCFVLSYATDPHARAALAAYADSCAEDFGPLAEDLKRELERTAPCTGEHCPYCGADNVTIYEHNPPCTSQHRCPDCGSNWDTEARP